MMAARLAVAATAIDLGPGSPVAEDVVGTLRAVLDLPFHAELADFRAALERATSVLYLDDNAGEIVVDRLLVEQIGPSRVTVAVRRAPVLNDATVIDARESGLTDLPGLAGVVSNGSDAPATLLEDCDDSFRARFDAADMVVAKGRATTKAFPVPLDRSSSCSRSSARPSR
jgi:damage-control phosphatase, subfamily I